MNIAPEPAGITRCRAICARIDRLCGRLNNGLAIVAVGLAVLVFAVALGRMQHVADPSLAENFAGIVGNE